MVLVEALGVERLCVADAILIALLVAIALMYVILIALLIALLCVRDGGVGMGM